MKFRGKGSGFNALSSEFRVKSFGPGFRVKSSVSLIDATRGSEFIV